MGTLKAGDRVKHTKCTICGHSGEIGEVESTTHYGARVKFKSESMWCSFESLEKQLKTYDAASVEVRLGGVLMGDVASGDLVTIKKKKLRYSLIPANVVELLAKVFQYGAEKHGSDSGWQSLDPMLYQDALERHLIEIKKGVRVDESGYPHWAHVLCNAAMCLWHDLKRNP